MREGIFEYQMCLHSNNQINTGLGTQNHSSLAIVHYLRQNNILDLVHPTGYLISSKDKIRH